MTGEQERAEYISSISQEIYASAEKATKYSTRPDEVKNDLTTYATVLDQRGLFPEISVESDEGVEKIPGMTVRFDRRNREGVLLDNHGRLFSYKVKVSPVLKELGLPIKSSLEEVSKTVYKRHGALALKKLGDRTSAYGKETT